VEFFAVLSDPVRRRILELLAEGEQSSGAIVEVISGQFGIGQPAVSMQLKVLRDNDFVQVRADGARRVYAIAGAPWQQVDSWLGRFRTFWDQPLDALETELTRGKRRRPAEGSRPRKGTRTGSAGTGAAASSTSADPGCASGAAGRRSG